MSQYLSFELVNKANPEIKVDLGYWCTSIARGISSKFDGIFPYANSDVKLDFDTLKSYIEILHDGINEYKESLRESQDRKKEYIDLLLKAQTEAAVKSIKIGIQYTEESISAWEEDIETWTMVENKLEFILYLMDENSKEWDLVYKNS
jgi:hypothetical protein